MPTQDQLEIIGPDGQIAFHVLDPGKGVTNIGRHPDNDLVLDSPGVASFQAVLDHQQKPYRIMALTAEGEVLLGGERLTPNRFHEVQDWDEIQFDGYLIVFLEGMHGEAALAAPPAAAPPPPVVPGLQPVPGAQPESAASHAQPAPERFSVLPPDMPDDLIIVEMPERAWTTDVEQVVTFQVTVVNGGSLVAGFEISVEGLYDEWVTVTPPTMNLNEGARGTATVFVQAPRLPTSRAGLHNFVVTVTSPNYPERSSRLGATLTINPFYEYTVGDLSPKQQTISWRKRTGEVTLPITNRGNSIEAFRLSAEDDERGCQFEFELAEEGARLVKQAELRLEPLEHRFVPVCITPMRRRLVALRKRTYPFTITTTQVEGVPSPRMVMGQVKSAPLIGPLLLFLIALVLFALLVGFTRPVQTPLLVIDSVARPEGESGSLPGGGLPAGTSAQNDQVLEAAWASQGTTQIWLVQADSVTTMPDEAVTLRYNGARFQRFSPRNILNRINGLFLELRLEYRGSNEEWRSIMTPPEFEEIAGTVQVVVPANGRYRLRADTWVSNLVPMLSGTSREISVYVTPVQPKVVYFRAVPERPLIGSEVTITWRVEGAETLTLSYEGIEETLQDQELETGSRTLVLNADTVFTLVASNRFSPEGVKEPLTVFVLVPTATPIPTPVIERFNVDPLEITEGETVRLSWLVTGADTVSIDPLGGDFLLQGDIGDQPTVLTTYRLTARKIAEDGTEAKNSVSAQVFVNPPPTPTPEPQAPEVQVFEAAPKEIVAGDDTAVTLTWSVSGKTTDIQITGGGIPLTGLDPQGSLSITISDEVIFVLTAYNGALSSSKHVQISTIEATPIPPDAPIIEDFSAEIETGKLVSYDPNTEVYKILEKANVTLKWVVTGEDVEIELNGNRVSGTEKDMGPIDADVSYQLIATNESGDDVRDLHIRVVARDVPAPEAFTYDSSTRKFTWKHSQPDNIEGFRLYKTPGQRVLVASTLGLGATDPERILPGPAAGDPDHVYEWVLPAGECGVFFIVAVYDDPYDDITKETDAAADSWGVPCP